MKNYNEIHELYAGIKKHQINLNHEMCFMTVCFTFLER